MSDPDPATTAHLHRTDFDADSCPICFPDADSDNTGQPCTGCGVTLFGYPVPRCEWCAHADAARDAERQRIREHNETVHGWFCADLLDGDGDA